MLGASGELGARVAAALEARGAAVMRPDPRDVVLGRDVGVVVDASASVGEPRRERAAAVVGAGGMLVELTLDPSDVAWGMEHLAVGPGTVAYACGLLGGMGELLTAVALDGDRGGRGDESHVTYALPDRRGLAGASTPGLRRAIARWVAGQPVALPAGGEPELVAETRRLAWFPRPVGPVHAASIPTPECWTLPLTHRALRVARTYVALPSWKAELVQALGGASRSPRFARRLTRRLTRPRAVPGAAVRSTTRWACVAELPGADGVTRAWAYGHDPLTTGAELIAAVVSRVAGDPGRRPGVAGPSSLVPARDVLDELAVRTDLRWSVTRPRRGTT